VIPAEARAEAMCSWRVKIGARSLGIGPELGGRVRHQSGGVDDAGELS
jgi:hypothetical protein